MYNSLSKRHSNSWVPSIIDSFINDPFFAPMERNYQMRHISSPAVNIIGDDKKYELEIAAPGMSREDFKISIEKGDEIVISLEKKEQKDNEGKNYIRHDFSYAAWKQIFTIPDDVEADAVTAEMTDGVLHVMLPKKEADRVTPESRLIEIQ